MALNRHELLAEDLNFSSDRYSLLGHSNNSDQEIDACFPQC